MTHLDVERLEALASGQEAAQFERNHLDGCPDCRRELAWLERERALFSERRERAELDETWAGIEARLAAPESVTAAPPEPPLRRWVWAPLVSAAVAAAFVLTVLPLGLKPPATVPNSVPKTAPKSKQKPKKDPNAALDEAERAYNDAASTLEARYKNERGRLSDEVGARLDAELRRSRDALDAARAEADRTQGDPEMRASMLRNYADYVHALHSLLVDLDQTEVD
jgi:hypothetical protein